MNSSINDVRSWSKTPVPIKDFLRRFELPQVVRIYEGDGHRFQAPGHLNLHQPILLYKVYTCRKIHARGLAPDGQGGVKPSGPSLVIPDNYQGWLAMVTKDGRTAGFFTSIGQVSRAEVPMFLVQDGVVGLKATSSGLCRTMVRRGQVLKAIGPYEDLNRQNVVLENSGHVHPDIMMYLKCLTQQGDLIFLPYSSRGRFYCISSRQSHTINHIFLISNLLRVTPMPILVRVVSGSRPQLPAPLTDVIKLEEIREEMIILGCTLIDQEPVLLEINANSSFSFIQATDDEVFRQSDTYLRMLHFCTTEGDKWRQQIRVAHHVIPETPHMTRKMQTPTPQRSISPIVIINDSTRSKCSSSDDDKGMPSPSPTQVNATIKFKKSTCGRNSILPKKFWMFRKAKKLDISAKSENGANGNCVNMISFSKSKNHIYTTVKITTSNGAEVVIGGEKVRLEVQRFANSDDGYVTSHADEESIYHSIC